MDWGLAVLIGVLVSVGWNLFYQTTKKPGTKIKYDPMPPSISNIHGVSAWDTNSDKYQDYLKIREEKQ